MLTHGIPRRRHQLGDLGGIRRVSTTDDGDGSKPVYRAQGNAKRGVTDLLSNGQESRPIMYHSDIKAFLFEIIILL
jgi:hypothetical protein